jgi:hypothetical protein
LTCSNTISAFYNGTVRAPAVYRSAFQLGAVKNEKEIGDDVSADARVELHSYGIFQELEFLHPYRAVDGDAEKASPDAYRVRVLSNGHADGFLPVRPYRVLAQPLAHRKPVQNRAKHIAEALGT